MNEITLIYEIPNNDEIYGSDQGFQGFKYIKEENSSSSSYIVNVTKVEDKEYKSKYDESFELLIDEKSSPFKIFGEKFVENNKNICKVEINNKETELCSFIHETDITSNIFEIKLKNIFNVSNMSYMFCGCISLISISEHLKINTNRVVDMSFMFCGCKRLMELPDMSNWNTINVKNMSFLFFNCNATIPDISKWDTTNVSDISYMFSGCEEIPDISNWNVSNVQNMSSLFRGSLDFLQIFKLTIK